MNITFYKNTSEVASFPKNLSAGYSVTGTLRSECDVLNPIIEFSGFSPALEHNGVSYNYAYIDEFKRYYFITGSNSVRDDVVEISFHVDVLQTYWEKILEHEAFVNRSTNVYNPWIIDDKIPMYQNFEVKSVKSNHYHNIEFIKSKGFKLGTPFYEFNLESLPIIINTAAAIKSSSVKVT